MAVYESDYSAISGAHDLIVRFPAGGFDYSDLRFTAVLTLGQDSTGPVAGTFADLQILGPHGDISALAETGTVTSSLNPGGRLILRLLADKRQFEMTLNVAVAAQALFEGWYSCCAGTSGTFSATRKKPE